MRNMRDPSEWHQVCAEANEDGALSERIRILDMLRAKESSWQAQCDAACSENYRDECRGAMQALRSAIEWVEASK